MSLRERIRDDWDYSFLGTRAHFEAVLHLVRGHKVNWFVGAEPWVGFFGFIECDRCPDTDGGGLCIWSRNSILAMKIGQKLCGWLGHRGAFEWNRDGAPCGEFGCERCYAPVPKP